MTEVFYQGKYLVKDDGTIFRKTKDGFKELSYYKTPKGYITITINGKTKQLHRFIVECFKGKSDLHVDHINKKRDDNRLDNLEYVTLKENNIRALGKKVKWNDKTFRTQKELSDYLGLTRNACNQALRNGYKLKGFKVEYVK